MTQITRASFEGANILQAHMKDNLAVFATSSNDLNILLFKPYKHYLASAKLEDGASIKLLRILGNGNHIFITDQNNNSFIISIN